jgi:hypothetical protein
MTAPSKKIKSDEARLLLAMYLDAECAAVVSYEECTYPGGIFNDRVWRKESGAAFFKLMKRVRRALGLTPFSHVDEKEFGLAYIQLAKFRAKEAALVERFTKS